MDPGLGTVLDALRSVRELDDLRPWVGRQARLRFARRERLFAYPTLEGVASFAPDGSAGSSNWQAVSAAVEPGVACTRSKTTATSAPLREFLHASGFNVDEAADGSRHRSFTSSTTTSS